MDKLEELAAAYTSAVFAFDEVDANAKDLQRQASEASEQTDMARFAVNEAHSALMNHLKTPGVPPKA